MDKIHTLNAAQHNDSSSEDKKSSIEEKHAATIVNEDFKHTDEGREHAVVVPNAQDAIQHLKAMKKEHVWDPNMPDEVEDELDQALSTMDAKQAIHIAEELLENSPYPEVRAAVLNYDSGEQGNTIRAWVIGMIMATFGSGLNALLSMRQPYIIITSYVAQVVAYPIGTAWARVLPEGKFTIRGSQYSLNPGPFNKKEHAIIVIMANATFGSGVAYATDIILAQRSFYHQRYGWTFEILLCISNMMLGFGLAGFFHRFLVSPSAMIWPSNLINTSLFNALHDNPIPDPAKTNGWKIGRYKMFVVAMIGSFTWYWFPGYIAPFLSVFAFVTWIKPQSPVINQLFGGWTGLSLIPITLDWSQISGFNFSPLIAPWFAISNTLIGMVVFYGITTIGLHYSNYAYSKYLPISDSSSYDNTGHTYNVSKILDPVTFTFVEEKYKAYSPLFLSTTFMLTYGLSFASMAAVLVHTGLFHGKELLFRVRNWNKEEEDVHARLMTKYAKVPIWWYAVVTVIMTAIAIGLAEGYPTHLTWWAMLFSFVIALIFFLPCGLVYATTNISIGINVITEFLIGYMQPGRPMAMMLFKAYGYMAMNQGIGFAGDMKLGHYMKVPPRVTFMAQMIACLWSAIVQVAVMNWALGSIEDVCTRHQVNHFSCPNGRVYFNASIIWGAIGPARIFSSGQMYHAMLYFFLPGALLPVVFYLGARRWPKSPIRYLSAPIIFGGAGLIPPATPLNYLSWGITGYIFNKVIRNRYRGWWMHYNYVLSAGLDVGLALCTILIFCTLQLTETPFPDWWGSATGASQNTMDAQGTAIQLVLPDGEKYGPTSW